MYLYLKALHIIFIVTWFAGLFYMVRLFIYNTEAGDKEETERTVLRKQFAIMLRRLWFGITWPSAVGTLLFGLLLWRELGATPPWLIAKFGFLAGLFAYHFSLHYLYRQQQINIFVFSSTQLRVWNEVATIFLIAIVFLAEVKNQLSALWGLLGLLAFTILLGAGIRIYRKIRQSKI